MRKILSILFALLAFAGSACAARKNIIGAEQGSMVNAEFAYSQGSFGSVTVSSVVARSGTYSYKFTVSGATLAEFKDVPTTGNYPGRVDTTDNITHADNYFRGYYYFTALPAGAAEVIWNVTDTSARKGSLRIRSDGKLAYYNSADTLQATGATVLSTNTWYRIETKVIKGTSAAWEVKIDGASEISGTTDNRNTDTFKNNVGSYDVGGSGCTFYFDDGAIDDAQYPGAGKVTPLYPTSNGTTFEWTNTYANIDEVPVDTGDYSDSPGSSGIMLTRLTTTGTAGITSGSTIKAIRAYGRWNGTTTNSFVQRIYSGGSTYDTPTTFNMGGTFSLSLISEVSPNGGAAYTTTELDSIEIGGRNTLNPVVRCYHQMLNVEWDAPPPTPTPTVTPTGTRVAYGGVNGGTFYGD
jgi:hypothetical protein